jgi:hypothetical protein
VAPFESSANSESKAPSLLRTLAKAGETRDAAVVAINARRVNRFFTGTLLDRSTIVLVPVAASRQENAYPVSSKRAAAEYRETKGILAIVG